MDEDYNTPGHGYISCMKQIVTRVNFIKDYLENINNFSDIPHTIELICLQYRKIFELIAISSLIANQRQFTAQHKQLSKDWHPERIIRGIKKINPDFYPSPIKNEAIHGIVVFKFKDIDETCLSEPELISAWCLCSDYLHIRNPFRPKLDDKIILNYFQTWWDKIQGLLYTHAVRLENYTSYLIADVDFSRKSNIHVSFIELTNPRLENN